MGTVSRAENEANDSAKVQVRFCPHVFHFPDDPCVRSPLPVPVSLVWFKPRGHSFVLKLIIHYHTQKQQIKTKNTIDPQKMKQRFGFITVTKQQQQKMIVSVQIYLKYLQ